jgi:N utilization substance protein B
VAVTLNEYIDMAKYYSTEKSHIFVNGILEKVIDKLTKEGVIKKVGKGLLNETTEE